MTHYPIDSLVSALGEAYPQVAVGRELPDEAITAALTPFLRSWVRHLDYEGSDYILEGYHVDLETAEFLSGLGFRVTVLGYHSVDPEAKCGEIRRFSRDGDWTTELSDSELLSLVIRFREESARLRSDCARRRLAYFEIGEDPAVALDAAFAFLAKRIG